MNQNPVVSSKLPASTALVYFFLGVLGCGFVCYYLLEGIYPHFFETIHNKLDFFTAITFGLLALYFFIRMTRKVTVYTDKITYGSMISKKEVKLKDLRGFYADLKYPGLFKGIFIRKKDGKSIALPKIELSKFDEIVHQLKLTTNAYNLKPVQKSLKKEDRKIFIGAIVFLGLLILSLLH